MQVITPEDFVEVLPHEIEIYNDDKLEVENIDAEDYGGYPINEIEKIATKPEQIAKPESRTGLIEKAKESKKEELEKLYADAKSLRTQKSDELDNIISKIEKKFKTPEKKSPKIDSKSTTNVPEFDTGNNYQRGTELENLHKEKNSIRLEIQTLQCEKESQKQEIFSVMQQLQMMRNYVSFNSQLSNYAMMFR